MKQKVKTTILDIIRENKGLESHVIREKLEEKGIVLTPDTVFTYLKKMSEEGLLKRETSGKPWSYHYYLK